MFVYRPVKIRATNILIKETRKIIYYFLSIIVQVGLFLGLNLNDRIHEIFMIYYRGFSTQSDHSLNKRNKVWINSKSKFEYNLPPLRKRL